MDLNGHCSSDYTVPLPQTMERAHRSDHAHLGGSKTQGVPKACGVHAAMGQAEGWADICHDVLGLIYNRVPPEDKHAMAAVCTEWNKAFYMTNYWKIVRVPDLTLDNVEYVCRSLDKACWRVTKLCITTASVPALQLLLSEPGIQNITTFCLTLTLHGHAHLGDALSTLHNVQTLRVMCPCGTWTAETRKLACVRDVFFENCTCSLHLVQPSLERIHLLNCDHVVFPRSTLKDVCLVGITNPVTIFLPFLPKITNLRVEDTHLTLMGESTTLRSLFIGGDSVFSGELITPYAEELHVDNAKTAAFRRLPTSLTTLFLETETQPTLSIPVLDLSQHTKLRSIEIHGFNLEGIVLGPQVTHFTTFKNDLEYVDCTLATKLKRLNLLEYQPVDIIGARRGCRIAVLPFADL